MTTNLKKYPTRIAIKTDSIKGIIALDQIRPVDKQRIIRVLDSLSKPEIQKCKEDLKKHLGIKY